MLKIHINYNIECSNLYSCCIDSGFKKFETIKEKELSDL